MRIKAKIRASFSQTTGREQFVPAYTTQEGGAWTTRWVGHHGSADLFSISEANSLFVVDAERDTVEAGEEVDVVQLFEW